MKKTCLKCGKSLSIVYFGEHKSNDDGYQIWCKTCTSKYQKSSYMSHAEDKKAQVAARRDRMLRVLERAKAKNPCFCGEDEPLCLALFPLKAKVPKVTKNSGVDKIRAALNGSTVICYNCRVKVEAGLLEAPNQPLRWNPDELEPEPQAPREPKPRKEKQRPALPPGAPGQGSLESARSDKGQPSEANNKPLPQ